MWLTRSYTPTNKHWLVQTANEMLDQWIDLVRNPQQKSEIVSKFQEWEQEMTKLSELYQDMSRLSKEYQDNPSAQDSEGKLKGITDRKHSINNSITAVQNHIVQYFKQHEDILQDNDVFDAAEKSLKSLVEDLQDQEFKNYLQHTVPLFIKK